MFLPLALGFVALAVLVPDIKHPTVTQDVCEVMATGLSAAPYKRGDNLLYSQGSSAVNDIAFRCRAYGVVVVNDLPTIERSVARGDTATLTHRVYRFWPGSWGISLQHPETPQPKENP